MKIYQRTKLFFFFLDFRVIHFLTYTPPFHRSIELTNRYLSNIFSHTPYNLSLFKIVVSTDLINMHLFVCYIQIFENLWIPIPFESKWENEHFISHIPAITNRLLNAFHTRNYFAIEKWVIGRFKRSNLARKKNHVVWCDPPLFQTNWENEHRMWLLFINVRAIYLCLPT